MRMEKWISKRFQDAKKKARLVNKKKEGKGLSRRIDDIKKAKVKLVSVFQLCDNLCDP